MDANLNWGSIVVYGNILFLLRTVKAAYTHMWQSHIEIEGYSVAYFHHGAHMRFVDSLDIHASTKHI